MTTHHHDDQDRTTDDHQDLPLTDTTATSGGGCCGHTPQAEDLADADSDDVTECLVMAGTPVIKSHAEAEGLFRDYQDQRYWFCCAACGPLFDADPDRYANAA
ncbi:hypothetical protein CEY15_08325 [Dietzia natronolimnaea]|uniref:Uncharacterized protein n=1 Tax=Dietzia natronolimnaea TaxID=161920 RepID=A0A2A2WQV0_9ACTN|nr:YHS domain-containing protein [Dietzia natronolimnaea]PAY23568.1 hypothetical protein CEY15_08325 [Dietzia natronolimnaea]